MSKYEMHPIRLPPGVECQQTHRTAYLSLPAEFFKEDVRFIVEQLEAMYLLPKPFHTPGHTEPCPACDYLVQEARKDGK